jgi:hypothetical protein
LQEFRELISETAENGFSPYACSEHRKFFVAISSDLNTLNPANPKRIDEATLFYKRIASKKRLRYNF